MAVYVRNVDKFLPSVVPKRKTFTVGPGGGGLVGVRDLYDLDLVLQTQADINNLIVKTTEATLVEQASIDNYATRLIVDKRDNKPLKAAERTAEAFFGSSVNLVLIEKIERTLRQEIRATTTTRTGKLSNVKKNWQWIFISREGGKKATGVPVNVRSPNFQWFYGDMLVLVPKRVLNERGDMYASTVNTLVAQKGEDYTPGRGKNKGITRRRNWGFARRTTAKVKRQANFSSVTVWAGHTFRHVAEGEIYHPKAVGGRHLTLFIAVRNRAKPTSGRGYRKFD